MWMQRSLVTALCVVMPTLALAQPDPAQGQETAPVGGFAIERMENGFVIAPDFKFTEIDDEFGSLAGLYGDWVMDRRLLIGGGAYWLANGSSDLEMAYGGAVAEWFANPGGLIDFSVRGLVGAGSATPSDEVDVQIVPLRGRPPFFRREPPHLDPVKRTVRFREGFFIAEPQANLLFGVADWFRITLGGGYRLIGGARGVEDRLRGATGTVGVQFSWQ